MRRYKVARLGHGAHVPADQGLTRLTVIENMRLGADRPDAASSSGPGLLPFAVARARSGRSSARADALLERFKLDHMRDEFAGNLSGGQRKLLEMARALMADPTLIMLDEPMAGVNPALKQSLLEHIKSLHDEGRTVLFVEHDMDMVHEISDWVVVMAEGQVIAEGTADVDRRATRTSSTPTSAPTTTSTSGTMDPMSDRCPSADVATDRRRPACIDVRPSIVAGYVPEVNILNGCNLTRRAAASSSASSGPTAPASRRS